MVRNSLICVFCISSLGFNGCRWAKDADDTVYKEFKASSLLARYEWFKDASAKLDAKLANIQIAEARLTALEKQYEGTPRKDWARHDAEQSSVWVQEVAGLKASFNLLAAEYNARMAKENYAFTNVGEMPRGLPAGSRPVPREYKQYIDR